MINNTLSKAIEADKILLNCRKEKRQPSTQEQVLLDTVEAARNIIVQVDSFARVGKEVYEPATWAAESRPAYTALMATVKR